MAHSFSNYHATKKQFSISQQCSYRQSRNVSWLSVAVQRKLTKKVFLSARVVTLLSQATTECRVLTHFCIHRLKSIVDWRWPLPCVHSEMMEFSTQLADGGGPCPPPLTLSTTSTRVTSELCTQINRPSPIFCGCDNKLAGTVPIVWIITHRWKCHKESTQRHIIVTAKSNRCETLTWKNKRK